MSFASGLFTTCVQCGSPCLTTTRESFNVSARIFVGHQRCDTCDTGMLYSRRPTREERKALAAPVSSPSKGVRMFAPETLLTLRSVTFGTEVVDQETRRVVTCQFGLSPFTAVHAEALNVKSLLFDSKGLPKAGLLESKVNVDAPPQRLTFAACEGAEGRIVIPDVVIDSVLKVKAKQDRDPVTFDATFSLNFRYPDAETLFYLANGVNNQHAMTFDVQQSTMDFAAKTPDAAAATAEEGSRYPRRHTRTPGAAVDAGDELRPGVLAEH